jgi:squalene-associated FAD-dependent desaturase
MRHAIGDDGMDLAAPRLPAPLHLLAGVLLARGLSLADKLSLARFSSAARWMGWQLNEDCSVAELLDRFDQTERLTTLMWRPLCISALNTPPERASAQVFLAVLRDSLGAARHASDMLLPRVDLSALFPDAAITWLEKQGGTVRMGTHVTSLERSGEGWIINGDWEHDGFRHVVVATAPSNAAPLLTGIDSALAEAVGFDVEPITTCYLQYSPDLALPLPMLALRDDPLRERWGQFVFDRGQLDAAQAGLLAVVVSASGEALAGGTAALEQAIARQLADALQMPALASPQWTKAVTEKRATFACTPGLKRPTNATAHEGLWLAGDYTEGEYPATIESAVRSGLAAARAINSTP